MRRKCKNLVCLKWKCYKKNFQKKLFSRTITTFKDYWPPDKHLIWFTKRLTVNAVNKQQQNWFISLQISILAIVIIRLDVQCCYWLDVPKYRNNVLISSIYAHRKTFFSRENYSRIRMFKFCFFKITLGGRKSLVEKIDCSDEIRHYGKK